MTDWLSSSYLSVVLLILTNTLYLRCKIFLREVALLANKYKGFDLFCGNINKIYIYYYYVALCDLKLLSHNSLDMASFDYRPGTLLVFVKKSSVNLVN